MRVAVLGTGIMGAGMAHSLLRSGLDVTVWNRHPGRAAPLAADGARVAGTAAEAVAGADAVITMLWDGDSVAEVMTGVLPGAPEGILWAQTSTVSLPDAAARLPALAAEHGARYIDAPVLGTRQPAEEGKLTVLAAGPQALREQIAPVFGAIGARTVWVGGRAGDGTRLKLVANSWVGTIVAATAQSIALAEGLGPSPSSTGRPWSTCSAGPAPRTAAGACTGGSAPVTRTGPGPTTGTTSGSSPPRRGHPACSPSTAAWPSGGASWPPAPSWAGWPAPGTLRQWTTCRSGPCHAFTCGAPTAAGASWTR